RKAMWDKIAESLPEEKEPAFAEFKVMIARLETFGNETGINGVLVYLDNQLCLSERQVASLRELFLSNWNSCFNNSTGMMAFNGMNSSEGVIELVSKEDFEKILSPRQFEALESLDRYANFWQASGIRLNDVDVEHVKAFCNEVMEFKIAEYQELVGITEQQMKTLTTASKRVRSQMVIQFKLVAAMETEDVTLAEPVILKCLREKTWRMALEKVFDEEQLQKIESREAARQELAADQSVNQLVLPFVRSLGLSYEQCVKLSDVLKNHLDGTHTSYFSATMSVPEVSDEEYQEILNDEQWQLFKPGLHASRAGLVDNDDFG
ncbi:hypothetical protein OAG68_02770, partial [bacterium]|nr:hypothetical protein [bacterium]